MKRALFLVSLLWWAGLAGAVFNHNLAPFGSVTLRWPHPPHPNAHFAWHQAPPASGSLPGYVQIQPGETKRFTVTLPRGFRTGELLVSYAANRAGRHLRLSADGRSGQSISATSDDSVARLSFDWAELAARGRRFDFQLTAMDTEAAALIQWIEIISRR